jgi:hypothetical protein
MKYIANEYYKPAAYKPQKRLENREDRWYSKWENHLIMIYHFNKAQREHDPPIYPITLKGKFHKWTSMRPFFREYGVS